MTDLNSLVIFAKVVQAQSFSKAARSLQMPVSTVSRRVAELEAELGVRLLERSTRALRLTDAGAEILVQAQATADLSDAVDAIAAHHVADVAGVLRLSAPPSLAEALLVPLLASFQAAYPKVAVDVFVSERFVDLVAESVDASFRIGGPADANLTVHRLLSYRHRLLASPHYLASVSPLTHPADLLAHRLLAFRRPQPLATWTFSHAKRPEPVSISFRPVLAMNDYAALSAALARGGAIGEVPPVVQPELLHDGTLVEVLTDWRFAIADLSLVHIASPHVPRPVRAFAEFARHTVPRLFPALAP